MSYSKRKFLQVTIIVIALLLFGISVILYGLTNLKDFKLDVPALLFIAGIIFGIIFSWFWIFMGRLGDRLGLISLHSLMGWMGERRAFKKLEELLPNNEGYKIYKNFKFSDGGFDIDAIVVGKKGLLIFEIKNISGNFRVLGDKFFKEEWCKGNKCICELNKWQNPIDEINRHELKLINYLEKQGIVIKSRKAILLVGKSKVIERIEPLVYIIENLAGLKKYLDDTYIEPVFNSEFCYKLNEVLSRNSKA